MPKGLSRDKRQRVMMRHSCAFASARALANRTRIILADEPWRQFVAATVMLDGT